MAETQNARNVNCRILKCKKCKLLEYKMRIKGWEFRVPAKESRLQQLIEQKMNWKQLELKQYRN